ncbi:hypothetical protein TNCV_4235731 [Trichonephila clavipes]|nr:hypothetical protein TNCV_4235731 [Trichonephila clavipes]
MRAKDIMHEQMLRSGSQSDVKPPVINFHARVVLIYRPTEGMKSYQPCLVQGLSPGFVEWKRFMLSLSHWASHHH